MHRDHSSECTYLSHRNSTWCAANISLSSHCLSHTYIQMTHARRVTNVNAMLPQPVCSMYCLRPTWGHTWSRITLPTKSLKMTKSTMGALT